MRAIPDDLDATIVSAIDDRLAGIERDHRVTIPWAIESGSRAWGFPSPDSDYDGRFLFVRPAADYLRLTPLRDVIETPLDAIYDVNGWDARKALALLVGGNATVVEWLRSPIIFEGRSTSTTFGADCCAAMLKSLTPAAPAPFQSPNFASTAARISASGRSLTTNNFAFSGRSHAS